MIVRCATTADVVRSIELARSYDLRVAVRAGGHSLTGDSFCDGGMVIDLSAMKRIRVDRERRIAHAEAGLTVGEFDRATLSLGLATVLGECSTVGIAGYTLGGGLGRLMGKYGAGCDNVLSAEVVTAEGTVLRASPDENPDLFWAIRGGGANFGVVTSLDYLLHPTEPVLGVILSYPLSDVRPVLTCLEQFMMSIPDELDVTVDIGNPAYLAIGATEPTTNLTVSYFGDLKTGEAALKPLRSFRKPLTDGIRAMTYHEMQNLTDATVITTFGLSGGSVLAECGFIERLSPQVIDAIEAAIPDAPECFWITATHYLHGAVRSRPQQINAFALRRSGFSTRFFSAWRGSHNAETSVTWVNGLHAAMEPFSGGAMYLNYLSKRDDEATRTAYGSNYQRLVDLKSRYDASNFFSCNRNIQPRKAPAI